LENKIVFDTRLIHKDILKKLNAINKPQRYLTEKLNISRATFWRMQQGKRITIDVFLTVLNWLDNEPQRYIYKK
jgi:hypothetical protein